MIERENMPGTFLRIIAAPALLLVLLAGCAEEIPPVDSPQWVEAAAGGGPWNVLLVTLDTTRSDRLGCYGYDKPTTPNIDELASRGILFERAVAPAPITLPSHATILTGLDPHENGVRNNNSFVLDSSYTTLAEVLRDKGYATGATLGAFPVDARFGLDQGFDSYDDDFEYGKGLAGLRMVQRTAKDVTTEALVWIGNNLEKPFFHWAHYFDPHFPYEPPPQYLKAFESPYDGEIAFMDAQIGRLVEGLERFGVAKKTWILLVGDHGESLDEHGELNHSNLIYGATQNVPCILVPPAEWKALPKAIRRGGRVPGVARLKDLAPTVLHGMGFADAIPGADGKSLMPMAAGSWEGPRAAYTETLAPSLEYGWSELRGVRTDRWSYIRAPEPELYDLAADPGELKNVYAENPDVAERLSALCDSFISREVDLSVTESDQETMDKLRSLGYTAVPFSRNPSAGGGKDPKKVMHLLDKINEARTFMTISRALEARPLLEEVLAEDPGNPQAARLYGNCLFCLGELEEAVTVYAAHLALFPDDIETRINMAHTHALTKQNDEALAILKEILEKNPLNKEAGDLYPRILVQAGRVEEARGFLEKGIAETPENPAVHVRYAYFELSRGETNAARRHASKAIELDEENAEAHTVMGEMLHIQGMRDRSMRKSSAEDFLKMAREHFDRALTTDPLESLAAFRMACWHHESNRLREARDLFQAALVRKPNWPEAHARMASVLWSLEFYKEGLQHYWIADTIGFDNPGFLLSYGNALAQVGQNDAAVTIWRKALSLNPPAPLAETLRKNIERLSQ